MYALILRQIKRQSTKFSNGYIMLLALIVVIALSSIGISISAVATSKYAKTKRDIYGDTALYIAEAGASDTISRLNDDTKFNGYSTEQLYYDKGDAGVARYTSTVTHISDTQKVITSIGNFYVPSLSIGGAPTASKKIVLTVTRNTTDASVGLYSGAGGLKVGARSKVLTPSLYSLGKITLDSSSVSIGDSGNPSTVKSANVACTQPDSNAYPAPCRTSTAPVSIASDSGGIYGSVCAVNQGQTGASKIFAQSPTQGGLQKDCLPTRNVIRPINRSTYLNNVPISSDASNASCSGNASSPFSGTYVGDVTMSNCNVRFPAILYIKGNLTITNSTLRAADTLGEQNSLIFVTGTITISNSSSFKSVNGSLTNFVSFRSSDAGCTNDITCLDLPDTTQGWTDARASQDLSSIVSNNSSLQGSNVVGYFGKATVSGSNTFNTIAAQNIVVSADSQVNAANQDPASTIIEPRWAIIDYRRGFNS